MTCVVCLAVASGTGAWREGGAEDADGCIALYIQLSVELGPGARASHKRMEKEKQLTWSVGGLIRFDTYYL